MPTDESSDKSRPRDVGEITDQQKGTLAQGVSDKTSIAGRPLFVVVSREDWKRLRVDRNWKSIRRNGLGGLKRK